MISPSTFFICEEFKKRGFEVTTFDDLYLALITKDGRSFYIHAAKPPSTSAAAFFACKNKYLTKQLLKHFKVATSDFSIVTPDIVDQLNLNFPLVIKPLNLSGGEGIVVGLTSLEEIRTYFSSRPEYKEAIVEGVLQGDDTRILIVGGKFFAAVQRLPASVIGDGKKTISNLVEEENLKRNLLVENDKKNQVYTTDLLPIVFDDEAKKYLADQKLSPDAVVEAGKRIFVRANANVSMGGSSLDVTDRVGGEIRKECERIAACFGLSVMGIDIITKDLGKPLSMESYSGVVEVNASPGLDLHILTDEGERRNPVPLIVDEIEKYLGHVS